MGDFQKGLCSCFDDCNICICSFCCPCIQFGKNLNANNSSDNCFVCGAFYLVLSGFCYLPAVILHCTGRTNIRKARNHNVGGSVGVWDFLTVCLCAPCALAQEAHEVGLGKA